MTGAGSQGAATDGFPTRAPVELEDRPRAQQWLVDTLWGEQAVGIVGGEPKCGKSILAMDLAVAVAAGVPCLRHFAPTRPGPVLMPDGACRMPCREPVAGDRIAWTEAAGQQGGVRTIEARVEARIETGDGHKLDLKVIRAAGPGAPEPGTTIQRTAEAVAARGCHRAPWRDEAQRQRIVDPPKQEQEQVQSQERSRGRGFSM